MLELVLVAGKIFFLVVLYLFVLLVIRSAVRDLRTRPSAVVQAEAAPLVVAPPASAGRPGPGPAAPGRAGAGGNGPWELVVVESRVLAPGSAVTLPSGRPVRLGRAPDNDIQLRDTFVSSHHATVEVREGRPAADRSGQHQRDLRRRRRSRRLDGAGPRGSGGRGGHRLPGGDVRLIHGAASHVGLVRKQNEDSFVAGEGLYAVCDGMGGARAGEVASETACETLLFLRPFATEEAELRRSVAAANDAIVEKSIKDPRLFGMGTTMTAAVGREGGLLLAHVGDSRAYLLRDGTLRQVTQDHSLVGEMVRRGQLTPEQAAAHPHRSVITRALGTETGGRGRPDRPGPAGGGPGALLFRRPQRDGRR